MWRLHGDDRRPCGALLPDASQFRMGRALPRSKPVTPDGRLLPCSRHCDEHGLQCGFCTPGIVMTLVALTGAERRPSSQTLLNALSGHLCRCTGYQGIKRAVRRLAAESVLADRV